MIKHNYILRLLVLSASGPMLGTCAAGVEDSSPREVREIAAGWRFQIDVRDIGEREHWYGRNIDRLGWRDVEVSKAWDLFDEAMAGYEGIGWYAARLDGSWARSGKVQHLRFGRVMYHAKVWLNGELLGEHIDGYLPFAFDITGKLKESDNLLVVRVDNRPRIDWLPAAKQIEWVQYGGILQPVRVETMGPVFFSDLEIRAVPKEGGASISCKVEIVVREDAGDLRLRLDRQTVVEIPRS
jgi:beta-galactosidase/beta-glucuronidase